MVLFSLLFMKFFHSWWHLGCIGLQRTKAAFHYITTGVLRWKDSAPPVQMPHLKKPTLKFPNSSTWTTVKCPWIARGMLKPRIDRPINTMKLGYLKANHDHTFHSVREESDKVYRFYFTYHTVIKLKRPCSTYLILSKGNFYDISHISGLLQQKTD